MAVTHGRILVKEKWIQKALTQFILSNKMKISVSNIAWEKQYLVEYLKLLRKLNCSGVEIAPSIIWPEPIKSSYEERKNFKKQINKEGLEVVGFHALLFSRPDLQLFESKENRKSTVKYIFELIQLCADLDGKQLIFGSPKNRKLHNRKYSECLDQAMDDFFQIAEFAKKFNVFFCIEPLGPDETDFIKSIEEGGNIVNKINHPFFKLHLDTKALFATKENSKQLISKFKNIIQHVHIGDEKLKEPGSINTGHQIIGQALKKINYSKYLSIEMRKPEKNVKEVIKRSVLFVKENYLVS